MVKKRIVSPDPPTSHKKKNSLDYDFFQRSAGMLYEKFLCCATPDFQAACYDDDGIPSRGQDANSITESIRKRVSSTQYHHHSLSARRGGDNLMSVHPHPSENQPSGFVFLEDDQGTGAQQRRFPRTRSGMTSTTASVSSAENSSSVYPSFPVITASQTFDEDDGSKGDEDDGSFNTCTLTPTRSNVSGSVISQSSLDYWEQPEQFQRNDKDSTTDTRPLMPSLTALREAQQRVHRGEWNNGQELAASVQEYNTMLQSVSQSQLSRLEGYRC